jgi:hypothetical protein
MGQGCECAAGLRQSGHREIRLVDDLDDGKHASGDATTQQFVR